MSYHRFATGVDALRFVRENLDGDMLTTAVIQIDDERYDIEEIRRHLANEPVSV